MSEDSGRSLYDADLARWVGEQITAIDTGRLHDIDRDHLIEELETLVRGDRNEVAGGGPLP